MAAPAGSCAPRPGRVRSGRARAAPAVSTTDSSRRARGAERGRRGQWVGVGHAGERVYRCRSGMETRSGNGKIAMSAYRDPTLVPGATCVGLT